MWPRPRAFARTSGGLFSFANTTFQRPNVKQLRAQSPDAAKNLCKDAVQAYIVTAASSFPGRRNETLREFFNRATVCFQHHRCFGLLRVI
jgi:hypothetical protein